MTRTNWMHHAGGMMLAVVWLQMVLRFMSGSVNKTKEYDFDRKALVAFIKTNKQKYDTDIVQYEYNILKK